MNIDTVVEECSVDVRGIHKVLGERPFGAVTLSLLDLGLHGGVIPAVGVLVELLGELTADKTREGSHPDGGELTDGLDAVGCKAFLGLLPDPEKIPHRERPHLLLDLALPEGVHLVWLLEIRCHLCQQLIGAYAHVNREAKFALHPLLELRGDLDWIPCSAAERHVDETLIDGELLEDWRVTAADGNEGLGAAFVPLPVTPDDNELGADPKSHRDRHGGLDADLLRRDGCGRYDAPTVRGVAGNDRRHQADVGLPFQNEFHRRPREESGVNVNVKDNPGHRRFDSRLI